MRPNLADPGERAAYRGELRRLKRGWRMLAVGLCLVGLAIVLYPILARGPVIIPQWAGWAMIGFAWLMFSYLIGFRTGYHKNRMTS